MKITPKIQKAMKSYPEFYQQVWTACAEIPTC